MCSVHREMVSPTAPPCKDIQLPIAALPGAKPRYKVGMPRFIGVASVGLVLVACGCRSSSDRPSRALASSARPTSAALPSPSDADAAPDATAGERAGDASSKVAADPPTAPMDARAECAVIAPARQLSFTGPMELSFAEGAPPDEPPRAIFNQDGGLRI